MGYKLHFFYLDDILVRKVTNSNPNDEGISITAVSIAYFRTMYVHVRVISLTLDHQVTKMGCYRNYWHLIAILFLGIPTAKMSTKFVNPMSSLEGVPLISGIAQSFSTVSYKAI